MSKVAEKATAAQASHTPGPWDDASKYPEIASVRIFAGSHYIATVGNSDDSREQTEANARLIAAAPELYAALLRARDALKANEDITGTWDLYQRSPEMIAILGAIAKAEGRTAGQQAVAKAGGQS
jgi:hypothetical protein